MYLESRYDIARAREDFRIGGHTSVVNPLRLQTSVSLRLMRRRSLHTGAQILEMEKVISRFSCLAELSLCGPSSIPVLTMPLIEDSCDGAVGTKGGR